MKRKCRNYWTKERCIEEGLKYKLRSKFKENSGGAYNASNKNGWLSDVCSNMSVVGNKFRRLVYVYEFDDKSAYVGLTYNIEERDNKHRRDSRSSVFKYIKKTGMNPELSYSDYIDIEDAKILEGVKINEYKNLGYNVLNLAESGAVGGGNLKWTKEKCIKEANNYKKRTKFAKGSNSAYNSARNNGWLDEICAHMDKVDKKPKGYWTKERCGEEVLKYRSKKELYNKKPGVYMSMFKNGWLDELCPHMKTKMQNGYWTIERCRDEANKFETRGDFQKNSGSAYRASLNNGWINNFFK